ncbi:hypothetical protein PVK06_035904 [Gossypium arboreum]|uniref:RNase H type-1 domain-containing protein n=1 Tax=Gossypium arboreum TaxID=29729 RepID=A0ABR0NIG7_GOSAR|nr:hypothetical protein PVK06_035904 [Gossypium arboreum]
MEINGWVKLNIDGAVSLNKSYVGIGEMFRDTNANWLWGVFNVARVWYKQIMLAIQELMRYLNSVV